MVHQGSTVNDNGSAGNPYTRAYRRKLGSTGISSTGDGKVVGEEMGRPATLTSRQTHWQQRKLDQLMRSVSGTELERRKRLSIGASRFLADATPTVGKLINYTQNAHSCTTQKSRHPVTPVKGLEIARVNQRAGVAVRAELAAIKTGNSCGLVLAEKPNNVI